MVDRQITNEILINHLAIVKRSGESEPLVVLPSPEQDGVAENIFLNMSISEGIYNNGVSGVLKIREPGILLDKFNIIGDEFVIIDMESPDIPEASKSLKFCVTNVVFSGDEASEALMGPAARADAYWTIEFGSCETLFLGGTDHADIFGDIAVGDALGDGDNKSILEDDMGHYFIGPIASEEDERMHDLTSLQQIGETIGDVVEFFEDLFDGEEEDEFPKTGLINHIAKKYFDPGATPFSVSNEIMKIEPTHNTIFLYKNKALYPWKKPGQNPNIIQLINYIAENSVTIDLKGVNYVFYADLDGWHFRSIRNIIQAGETDFLGIVLESARQYVITDADFPVSEWQSGHQRIQSFRVASEYNHLKLFNSGAYSSDTEIYKPNVNARLEHSPFLDGSDKKGALGGVNYYGSVKYHYLDDNWGGKDDGGQVEEYKLISENWRAHLSENRKSIYDDGIWGYFGNWYNNPRPNLSYPATLPSESFKWQSMYDQTNLKGSELYKIKSVIPKKYKEVGLTVDSLEGGIKPGYKEKRDLKRKWDVYKHVVCCAPVDVGSEEEDIEKYAFYAVIESATPIYALLNGEEEQDNGGEGDGGEGEETEDATSMGPDMGERSTEDDKDQQFRSNMYQYKFREVELSSYVNEELLKGNDEDTTNGEGSQGGTGPEGASADIEILYYNDEDTYPEHEDITITDNNPSLYVTIVPGGVAGTAYNTNELLNMGVLFDDDPSDVYNFFVGPGVNVAGANSTNNEDLSEMNDYPEGNRMLPVGDYVRSQKDPCLSEFHSHKHIVKMYAIPDWLHTQKGLIKEEEEEEEEEPEAISCAEASDCYSTEEQDNGGEGEESGPDSEECWECMTLSDDDGEPIPGSGVCEECPSCPEDEDNRPTLNSSKNTIYVFDVQNAHDGLCSCISN